ncbi:hypothetical protein, partial [Cupriavidus plantarum]
ARIGIALATRQNTDDRHVQQFLAAARRVAAQTPAAEGAPARL